MALPIRTCVGCRARRPQSELLRFALDGGGVVRLDYRGRMSGRGAWLCPRGECLATALKRRAFSRSFRRPVKAPPEQQLRVEVGAALEEAVDTALRGARRAGAQVVANPDDLDSLRQIALREPPHGWASTDDSWTGRIAQASHRFRTFVEGPADQRPRKRRSPRVQDGA